MSAAVELVTGRPGSLAGLGEPGGVLLGGPDGAAGAESLDAVDERLGGLPELSPAEVAQLVTDSGLCGRGGGHFPLARKLETVRTRAGNEPPAVVVNVSESEPASRKDRTLARYRPHLILDGAALLATAVGAAVVHLHLHTEESAVMAALRVAVDERDGSRPHDPAWRFSTSPAGYVAGESSAVLAAAEGGRPLPRWSAVPAAVQGLHGRPTLLSNAETFAHVGVLARVGADVWRALGPDPWNGPLLLTLQGAVTDPGEVIEVNGPTTIGAVLATRAGLSGPPAAVLVGGYAGSWVPGDRAWHLSVDRTSLGAAGASLGCGLLAVLPHGHCGLSESARLVSWLAAEGAGQCGPCAFGLPRMGTAFEALARGRGRAVDQLLRLADEVDGRGGCRHPDGVARLTRSAVTTFADDVLRHRRGRRCGQSVQPLLPLPHREPT
jgi:NADH:ubiquinone oxidoreductase subunit F (NADH-binding)